MADPRFDPLRIAASLRSHGVTYVLVGDIAAEAHGARVETDQTDLLLPEDDANLERLGLVLMELGARPLESGDAHRTSYETAAGRLHLIETEAGFDVLAAAASEMDLGRGVIARVASAEDVAAMRRESGDLAGAARLTTIAGAQMRADDEDDEDDSPGDAGPAPRRVRDRVWGALESVDTFLTDLDSRGPRLQRR